MQERVHRHRIPAMVLWCAASALAWAGLSLFLGGGTAHADDGQPSNPLSSITSAVANAVERVSDPVLQVVDSPTNSVTPVVQIVAQPLVGNVVAPAAKAAEPVMRTTAGSIVDTAAKPAVQAVPAVRRAVAGKAAQLPIVGATAADVAPVLQTLRERPLSSLTDPLLDLVDDLPIVGTVGAVEVVKTAVGVVDDTAATVAGATGSMLPALIDAPAPVTKPDATTNAPTWPDAPVAVTAVPADDADGSGSSSPTSFALRASAASSGVPAAGAAQERPTSASPTGPIDLGSAPALGATAAPASASAGSGGASAGPAAAISGSPAPPSASETRGGAAGDDALPPSPAASSDISPD